MAHDVTAPGASLGQFLRKQDGSFKPRDGLE